ncbi:MAG: hypothetical protein LBN25_03055, partial [Christensenellaceae bacterium]|nr:hypothetical protein [Christensenellaceae bacterium]
MMRITIRANPKLNLDLAVYPKNNGETHHKIDSKLQEVEGEIYDGVTLELTDKISETRVLYTDGRVYENDNALRAAQSVLKHSESRKGLDITIRKGIPEGVGLGGSSADAAAICKGYALLTGKDFANDFLFKLGADVPFQYFGGCAEVSGFGEIVKPVCSDGNNFVLLIYSGAKVATKEAFDLFDRRGAE